MHQHLKAKLLLALIVTFTAMGSAELGTPSAAAGTESFSTVGVTVGSNGRFSHPAISADGSTIVFASKASDLVSNDTNDRNDVFAYDLATATITLISGGLGGTGANGDSLWPRVSGDGSVVVYFSDASNLVPGDTNECNDVFLYQVESGTTRRVSVGPGDIEGNSTSDYPDISADGSTVVFTSGASNLVPADTNGQKDVFAYDIDTGAMKVVSVSSAGIQANEWSEHPSVSGDGSIIAYTADASNLVANDSNGRDDVYAFDAATGITTLVSVGIDGNAGANSSQSAAVSDDGSTIVFRSNSSTLVPNDTWFADIFAFDLATEIITLVSAHPIEEEVHNFEPDVSGDGSRIVYTYVPEYSAGTERVAIHVRDVASNTTTQLPLGHDGTKPDGDSFDAAVSATGCTVAYVSVASNLVVGDTEGTDDVFVTQLCGAFSDDEDSVFEPDIEWLAAQGITKGCNPPLNTLFCPDQTVTRGQMAAFLARALDLTDDGGGNLFTDDDASVFQASIDKLATAGITRGCNPPVNDMFCPNDPVTRGQMAAFLVRALNLTDDGGGNLFTDDDGNIFETSIDKLVTAGVTRGCNPPDNTMFCPDSNVTRGQMAAFLHRALG